MEAGAVTSEVVEGVTSAVVAISVAGKSVADALAEHHQAAFAVEELVLPAFLTEVGDPCNARLQ